MNRTASMTMQVTIHRVNREAGTATVLLGPPEEHADSNSALSMTVPLSDLDIDDPYDGWTTAAVISTTPASGAVIKDAHDRVRVRFYVEDGDTTSGPALGRARAFLSHLREHYPGGL